MHTLRDQNNTVGASMLRIKQKSVTKSLDPQSKIINTFAYNQLQNDGQNSSIYVLCGFLYVPCLFLLHKGRCSRPLSASRVHWFRLFSSVAGPFGEGLGLPGRGRGVELVGDEANRAS